MPIFGADISASALGAAAKLIGEDGVVYAIFVLPVPSQLSLDAGLEEEEAQGRSVLESARIKARRAGIKIHTGLIRTRNPGAALVEEAERVDADVIYWSTIHAPTGEQRIGPTAVVPAQQASLPGDHRDREPPPRERASASRHRLSVTRSAARPEHSRLRRRAAPRPLQIVTKSSCGSRRSLCERNARAPSVAGVQIAPAAIACETGSRC